MGRRSRRAAHVGVWLLLLYSGCGGCTPKSCPRDGNARITLENAGRIRQGFDADQVRQILGQPGDYATTYDVGVALVSPRVDAVDLDVWTTDDLRIICALW